MMETAQIIIALVGGLYGIFCIACAELGKAGEKELKMQFLIRGYGVLIMSMALLSA